VQNLDSPVRFSSAMACLLEGIFFSRVFVEIGPHLALAGPIRQILRHHLREDEYIGAMTRRNDAHRDVLKAIGDLWLRNIDFDIKTVAPPGNFLTDLPLYPWHYGEVLWHESRLSKDWRLREHPHHDCLGSWILESTDNSPSWRNMLRLDVVTWIKEHEVGGEIVFPGVGYLCMAGEAIRQLAGALDFTARHVHPKNALVMVQGVDVEIITQLERVSLTSALDSDYYNFTICSLSQGS
jgi:acyl transferase domain-containing protein